MGQKIPKDGEMKAGDLVFRPRGGGKMHVGILDGQGNVIMAPKTGETVRSEPYNPAEWTQAVRPWLGKDDQASAPPVANPTQAARQTADAARVANVNQNRLPGAFDFG